MRLLHDADGNAAILSWVGLVIEYRMHQVAIIKNSGGALRCIACVF